MNKQDLRIVFMGTPEFAVETLKALVDNGYNVVAVVTQPDKPIGRHGSVLQPSAVKQFAKEQGLPVLQPEKMKDPEFIERLRAYNANLQVVVAFRMLPEVVWAMPKYGTFNVHAALLPQYRGAAPINWAIINGETQTGVTTFFLDKDIDTGRIIMQLPFDIRPEYNVEDVYNGLMSLGAEICLKTLDKIVEADGKPASIAQEDIIKTHDELHPAPKIFKETCKIDWHLPSLHIHNFVRGLSPHPGAWTEIEDTNGVPMVLKIFATTLSGETSDSPCGTIIATKRSLSIVCGDRNILKIDELQMAGKKRMRASDFVNGAKIENFSIKI